MIHFQHAFVALRAMMGSVRLCSQASCTHPYSSELFTLKAHYLRGKFLGFFEKLVILRHKMKGSSLALDEPVVEVARFSWIVLVLEDLLVVEVFLEKSSSLLEILFFRKVLIIRHVPF